MLEITRVSSTSEELLEAHCPFCHDGFEIGSLVVQCPTCKGWHHVDCWRANSNRCSTHGCNGKEVVSDRLPPEPTPPLVPEEITIAPPDSPPTPDPESLDELLGQIEIVTQGPIEVISIYDDWQTPAPQGAITIEPWELKVDAFAKKMGVDDLFQKTGMRARLSKNYFTILGIVLVCLLVLILVLLIVILVNIAY